MSNGFGTAFKSFWHTMTSYDRHSSFDSPHRTGRHVPLPNGRSSILTGVATASDSRPDVSSPYFDQQGRSSPLQSDAFNPSLAPYTPTSPSHGPYSPGLRGVAARNSSQTDGFEVQSPTDVPMQSFQDGLPPPPPVGHSWRRIDAWAEDNYPELWDQLCEGATVNDLNDLEHQLDCSLPQDVRESLMIHDGQERGGNPTGIIFGSMLMDCEEIVQEWEQWRRVNHEYLLQSSEGPKPATPSKAFGGSDQASSSRNPPSRAANNDEWRENLQAKQNCVPPNTIQKTYAHIGWIPLVRDWGGNNLAIDLAPGPSGQWGQVILFGRDYDTKYVVARSWGAFLALVADDLKSGKWFVDEDTQELKLREFKDARVEPAYFNILRWRMDQKHGRRAAQRKSMAAGKAVSPGGSRSSSPYASSLDGGDARGRTMQRLNGSSPLASPMRPAHPRAPPLGMVTEEASIPELGDAHIDPDKIADGKLVDVATPRQVMESKLSVTTTVARSETDLLTKDTPQSAVSPQIVVKPKQIEDENMKTIEI